MPKIDLREYKKEIRSQMRRIRREMSPQTVQEKNDRIYKRLIATQQYRRAKTVVVYVSKELEVDTRRLMEHCMGRRQTGGCTPLCGKHTTDEDAPVGSMEDLEEGAYGILEPYSNLPVLEDTTNAICIVPAFCNDYRGYRVGYGGGYYDRYLSTFQGVKIGVNYSDCVRPKLIGGRYDVPVDLLVTDCYLRRCTTRPSVRHRKPVRQGTKGDAR